MRMFSVNKAASYGLAKLAKDIMNDIQEDPTAGKSAFDAYIELCRKYHPDVDDEELLKREDTPNAEAVLNVIYKYAPGLRGKNVGLDDDLTDEAKWNEPWNDETKQIAAISHMLGAKNKKDEEKRRAMLAEAFKKPRFIGFGSSDDDHIHLGIDLEDKYGVDLSDTDGDFYKAKSVNDILAALKTAPKAES